MPENVSASIRRASRGATIVVVDDTEANRYAVARHLTGAGYRVVEAANGTDGLRLVREERPALVILDVRLPDFSGFELARRLRADEQTATIPILHISASFTDPESRAQGLENGADGYLTHPVEPAVMLATVRSLLGAREAERQATATARAWRATFDAIAEGVCVVDQLGMVVRCNRAFTEITGRTCDGPVRETLPRLVPNARLRGAAPFVEFVDDGGEPSDLFQLRGRWVRASAEPLADLAGVTQGAVCVFADVTRQRAADERLRQAQQLEVTGRLAGGVAHEINNMMTIILGYSGFVLQRIPAHDPSHADLEQVHRAATRAAEIARQLLTFSRRQPFRPAVLDLAALIEGTARTLHQLIGADRELRLLGGGQPAWIEADAGYLEQVLVNLALNARDAMPDGGVLTVQLDRIELDAHATVSADGGEAIPGPYIRLRVADTGCGMDAETLAHAFEPFFTTKEVGSGTGLGLATVYGIVRQANGFITASSEPGRGSVFTILLPVATPPEDLATAGPPRNGGRSFGRETVLVVEDEPAVLELARRSLEGVGYHVLDAANGRDGLERLRTADPPVRLIVSDVVMPGMSGPAFAAAARARSPGVRVLFMSGYTNDEIEHRQLLPSGEHFIAKPFTPAALAERVRELLEPRGAAV
jgi:PAS domain S-box-containing protein